ncbi:filament-like plant protein [Gossypium australe]|uniref:Filament-like plant protein n=1 Tax=Gossypium australe TaxID=47621 RepID=A0A5B6WES7_9ROSI|nr:filament-like plant protein [Gossypium australe]
MKELNKGRKWRARTRRNRRLAISLSCLSLEDLIWFDGLNSHKCETEKREIGGSKSPSNEWRKIWEVLIWISPFGILDRLSIESGF